jgi:hypothetical protein
MGHNAKILVLVFLLGTGLGKNSLIGLLHQEG